MFARMLTLLAVLNVAAMTGCSDTAVSTEPHSAGLGIQGAGATFPAPLYEKWIEEYQKEFPLRNVSYDVVGSGQGVDRFLAGTVDFGASDAALSDAELAELKQGAVLIPVTAGSLVIAYNLPGLSGPLKLSREVYVDLFLGEIKNWNDARIQADNPNLKLPDLNVVVVARQDSSGTTFVFTNHLSAVSEHWRDRGPGTGKVVDWPGAAMLADGNEGVAAQIKRSEGAIGYVQYGIAKRLGLKMAWLENKAGNLIQPTGNSGLATLIDAQLPPNLRAFFPDPDGKNSYPIVSLTWLLVYGEYDDASKGAAVKHFIEWCLEEGQQYCEGLGYIRIAPRDIAAAKEALNTVNVGE